MSSYEEDSDNEINTTNKDKDNDIIDNDITESSKHQKPLDFTKSKKTDLIHFLPCKIEHDGFAPVSTFFEPTIRPDQDNDTYVLSSFRGKKFRGRVINEKLQTVELEKIPVKQLAMQEKQLDKYVVCSSESVSSYYIWEFDQFISECDNLANIQRVSFDLDVLK